MVAHLTATTAFSTVLRIALIGVAEAESGPDPLSGEQSARVTSGAPDDGLQRDADRARCRTQLDLVQRSDWWDAASSAEIVTMFETAIAWRDVDLVARDADEAIRDELLRRYGISLLAEER
ncbi:MAG: hypothetical protein H7248_03800 [Microbacteriaceae bacterium]|nr:hypothetical protein [Microbacteriaceae bacterium]